MTTAERLAFDLLYRCGNAKHAQAIYREANAAGVGDLVSLKFRMGNVWA